MLFRTYNNIGTLPKDIASPGYQDGIHEQKLSNFITRT